MTDHDAGTGQELGQRVDRLERLAVGAYAVFIGAMLFAGLCTPFLTMRDVSGDFHESTSLSVLSSFFATNALHRQGFIDNAVLTALFLGSSLLLLVLAVLLLLVLITATRGRLAGQGRRLGSVVVGLGLLCSLVLAVLVPMAVSYRQPHELGWGGIVLLLGTLGVVPLLTRAADPLVSPQPRASTAP
ncbi:hypothetical protein [Arthrobacter sp. RCC_34]|uniref:hypothetical protein n=1 Tax=Arthrobacter sp. RCC_34 TaxID=3239230 RepID=UPI0035251143